MTAPRPDLRPRPSAEPGGPPVGGPTPAAPDPAAAGTGGCSAANPQAGTVRPVLGAAFTKPYRWEVLPHPNPYCEHVEAMGEDDSREAAEGALRQALAPYAAGFGFLYEVTGTPPSVRELARIPIAPPAPKPPQG
jgi:hypothetical protein